MKPWILFLLVLAGCVPDSAEFSVNRGRWADYHDMLTGVWEQALAKQAAPQPVKDAFAKCVADRTDKYVIDSERAQLDAYARGDQGLSIGDSNRIDAAVNSRSGLKGPWTNDNVGLLADTCPNDVASFRQYLTLPPT